MPKQKRPFFRGIVKRLMKFGRNVLNNKGEPLSRLAGVAVSQLLPDRLFFGQAWPRISIVTPSLNQGKFIAETIESVIAQQYPNLEFIIVDGGSTDETLTIIEKYKDFVDIIISEPDRGQSDAINKGFARATGEIFTWLNSDDCLAPGALAAVAVAFASHTADLVCGICEVLKDGELLNRHLTSCADGPLPLEELLDLEGAWAGGQFFYQPEVFFKREIWIKAGEHVREDCYYSMDYELWCRFALVDANIHVVGRPLVRFRMHSEQKTAIAARYQSELKLVRDEFLKQHSLTPVTGNRPPVDFSRRLRIAMINDLGREYGAGIAHGRTTDCFRMAGHETLELDLQSTKTFSGDVSVSILIEQVKKFKPNLVVFGNLHGALKSPVEIVQELSTSFDTITVVHDFWMFTGRCAYTESCDKFLTGCDESCPTSDQYPTLQLNLINDAWNDKRKLWSRSNAPVIASCSAWADTQARKMTANIGKVPPRHGRVRLGAPAEVFAPLDKNKARGEFQIEPGEFVIVFSVSSFSDERKGGRYLREALSEIKVPNVTLILLGYQGVTIDFTEARVISLGYVTDVSQIVLALNAADVYVGPSLSETFGQVFIEAALCGLPSIGFRGSGVEDAIADGITGYLVPRSTSALSQAILKLYYDRKLCADLGLWARLYAQNEFSIESMYHSYFVLWRDLGLVDKWKIPHKIYL